MVETVSCFSLVEPNNCKRLLLSENAIRWDESGRRVDSLLLLLLLDEPLNTKGPRICPDSLVMVNIPEVQQNLETQARRLQVKAIFSESRTCWCSYQMRYPTDSFHQRYSLRVRLYLRLAFWSMWQSHCVERNPVIFGLFVSIHVITLVL